MGEAADVAGYEKGAAALLFINFVLSTASGYFTLKAVTEIKQKQVGWGDRVEWSGCEAGWWAGCPCTLRAHPSHTATHGIQARLPPPPSVQRETQYHEMAALSDNLQFEPDA